MTRALAVIGLCAAGFLGACEKKPVSISLSPPTAKLDKAGMSQTFTAQVLDADGQKLALQPTWTSSNDKVATVSTDGKVVAVGSGTAQITASQETLTKSAAVIVEIPSTIKLSENEIKINKATDKPHLTATVVNEKGMPLVNPVVKFMSDNVAIAMVDQSGDVTGVKRGTTNIIATYGQLKAVAKVVVEAAAEEKVATAKMEKKSTKKKK